MFSFFFLVFSFMVVEGTIVLKDGNFCYRLVDYSDLSASDLDWLENSYEKVNGQIVIGLDTEFDGSQLGLIQLGTRQRALLIRIRKRDKGRRNDILGKLISDATLVKAGAELWQDAALMKTFLGLSLEGGLDLSLGMKGSISLFGMYEKVFGLKLRKDKAVSTMRWTEATISQRQINYAALDAHVSFMVGFHVYGLHPTSLLINESKLNSKLLELFNSFIIKKCDVQRLSIKANYSSSFSNASYSKAGDLDVLCSQFRNKLNLNDRIVQTHMNGTTSFGKVIGVKGKSVKASIRKGGSKGDVTKITVVEASDIQAADSKGRCNFFSQFYSGALKSDLMNNSLFINYFLGGQVGHHDKKVKERSVITKEIEFMIQSLNKSQREACRKSLCSPTGINLIHGPPGTGKTTVISHIVEIGLKLKRSFVLTAQSNVATRNLADSLLKRNITAFHVIWHEAGYEHLNVLKSSDLANPDSIAKMSRSSVILCTVSQLSNPKLHKVFKGKSDLHWIMDEASQVHDADFPHLFHEYRDVLKRVTFVGDHRQLAPYGSDNINNLTTPFDRIKSKVFLDLTYRLPREISDFVSGQIYNGKLRAFKNTTAKCPVILINAKGREEEAGSGKFSNENEIQIVVKLIMDELRDLDFLVVTGYNNQREKISERLKATLKLKRNTRDKSEAESLVDRIRSIDSVQGQEADIVVLSLVRTQRPGFLANEKRLNVAMTRAKKRLIVVSNTAFLEKSGSGGNTLIGKMHSSFKPRYQHKIMSYNEVISGKRVLARMNS